MSDENPYAPPTHDLDSEKVKAEYREMAVYGRRFVIEAPQDLMRKIFKSVKDNNGPHDYMPSDIDSLLNRGSRIRGILSGKDSKPIVFMIGLQYVENAMQRDPWLRKLLEVQVGAARKSQAEYLSQQPIIDAVVVEEPKKSERVLLLTPLNDINFNQNMQKSKLGVLDDSGSKELDPPREFELKEHRRKLLQRFKDYLEESAQNIMMGFVVVDGVAINEYWAADRTHGKADNGRCNQKLGELKIAESPQEHRNSDAATIMNNNQMIFGGVIKKGLDAIDAAKGVSNGRI